jgi:hypothetical protein
MMRFIATFAVILGMTCPVQAWEKLITQQGIEIQGDITQQEFVLLDEGGGEVAIPRAAIVRFEATPTGLRAMIKDGTVVVGKLQGKIEIEDGLIRRRYPTEDIKSIDFDQYIVVEKGKKYESCPIRVDLDAGVLLLADGSGTTSARASAVECKALRIASMALNPKGKIKPGKPAMIAADLILVVPEGEDQLIDVSGQLLQGDAVLAKAHKRLTANEGENVNASLALNFPGDKLERSGPPPHLLLQVVSQDSSKQVEKGGFFWWFTIPIL